MFLLLERDHISSEILYVSLSLSPNSETYCTQNFWNLFICCVIDSYCCSLETWGRCWFPVVCHYRIFLEWKVVIFSQQKISPGGRMLVKYENAGWVTEELVSDSRTLSQWLTCLNCYYLSIIICKPCLMMIFVTQGKAKGGISDTVLKDLMNTCYPLTWRQICAFFF